MFYPTMILFLQDQNLGNWQVKRQVGSGAPIAFKFPAKFTLRAGQRVTVSSSFIRDYNKSAKGYTVPDVLPYCIFCFVDQIWASGTGGSHNPPSDLVWKTQPSWGTGDLFQTTLISANGEVFEFPWQTYDIWFS